MPTATALDAVTTLLAQHLGAPVAVVRHLPARPSATQGTVLWPWRIEDGASRHAMLHPAADGARAPDTGNVVIHALLLPASLAELDAAREALHAQPVMAAGGATLQLLVDVLPADALCALFTAARAPLQLALPVQVRVVPRT